MPACKLNTVRLPSGEQLVLNQRRVVVETPYAGDVPRNLVYLRACLRDCLNRGETPYASHAILTQPGVLNDLSPDERSRGMSAGYSWQVVADLVAVYTDLGTSAGMRRAIAVAGALQKPFEFRTLPGWVEPQAVAVDPHELSPFAAATLFAHAADVSECWLAGRRAEAAGLAYSRLLLAGCSLYTGRCGKYSTVVHNPAVHPGAVEVGVGSTAEQSLVEALAAWLARVP